MNLSDLIKGEKIRKAAPDAKQSSECLAASERDLRAAKAMLDTEQDWAFSIAYNSMLQSARALMFADGYRALGEDYHKTVVEYADVKLGAKIREQIDALERMRPKRHRVVYEKSGLISRFEADFAIKTAEKFLTAIKLKLKE